MRYLSKFESYGDQFISFESENYELISDIKDILLDCEDVEIKSTFWTCKYYLSKKNPVDAIRIILQDNQNRFFRIEDILPILSRIKTVTDLEEFSINLDIPSEDDTEMTFEDFIQEFNGEELYRLGMFIY